MYKLLCLRMVYDCFQIVLHTRRVQHNPTVCRLVANHGTKPEADNAFFKQTNKPKLKDVPQQAVLILPT